MLPPRPQVKHLCTIFPYMSDRAQKELPNSTMMLWLIKHDSHFKLLGKWVFTEPKHRQSDCDGLRGGIRKRLWQRCATLPVKQTPQKCVDYVWKHTKGVPMRGKYSKCKEYRFKTLPGRGVATPAAQTITGITKRIQCAAVGK